MKEKKPLANQKEVNYLVEIYKKFTPKNEVKENKQLKNNAPVDEIQKKWDMNDKIVDLFTGNIGRDQKLREKYAIILIKMLAFMLVALIVIFVLTGCGVLKYSDTTFNIFITGGIAEIFILVRVIVKYLFKDNLTDALTIILKRSNELRYNKKTQQKFNNKNMNKSSDKSN